MARPRAKLDRCGEADLVTRRLNTEPPGARRERLLAVQLGLRGELGLDRIAQAVGTPLTDRLPSLPGSGEPNYAWRDTPRIIQGKSRPAWSPPLLSRTFPVAAADEGKRRSRWWTRTCMLGALGLPGGISEWRRDTQSLPVFVPFRRSLCAIVRREPCSGDEVCLTPGTGWERRINAGRMNGLRAVGC